jgi:hypothetical protein
MFLSPALASSFALFPSQIVGVFSSNLSFWRRKRFSFVLLWKQTPEKI